MTRPLQPNHVLDDLSAYANGQLTAAATQQVAEHLLKCPSCRLEYDRIRVGVGMAERLPTYRAPEGLWKQLESQLESPADTPGPVRFPRPVWIGAAAAALLLAVVSVAVFWADTPSLTRQRVFRVSGLPRVEGDPVSGSRRLEVGQSLTTDAAARARIELPGIGEVLVHPFSRVRLLEATAREQRLALDSGGIEATISAPPRLFFVETPGALAVDLGCAYTLDVDEQGNGLLQVTAGWVGLEHLAREVRVPAGTACRIQKVSGPGYPYRPDASPAFLKDLFAIEFEPGREHHLEFLLNDARPADTLSLWYVFQEASPSTRSRLLPVMLRLAPPAGSLSPAALQQNEPGAWLTWRGDLEQLAADVD